MTKRSALGLICLTEFLGMSVWFSASAVVPALREAWGLSAAGQAWLTMSVQLGFVGGALGSAMLNLADRVPARWLFSISSLCLLFTRKMLNILWKSASGEATPDILSPKNLLA